MTSQFILNVHIIDSMNKLKESNFALGVLGVLFLALGVLVGVMLVGQNQDFRNRAKESVGNEKATICHKNNIGFWEEIDVDYDDLRFYLNSGDILGECPVD